MWVESQDLENIRCFESASLRFLRKGEEPYQWVTFLGENGCGKSTALLALGLLLAGPEGAQSLLPRPLGWLRDESKQGKISARIHQADDDPGQFGSERIRRAYGFSYSLTGIKPLTVNNRLYTEPSIVPAGQKTMTWLRENAFPSEKSGWFAAGYGAFRRLTRSSQVIIPSLQMPARFTNFLTQFDEAEPLSVFERWMIYVDYRIAKENAPLAKKQREIGISAINKVLPVGSQFHKVTSDGKIWFKIGNQEVPTIGLSDGYRSVLALTGDLIWRLIQAFPESDDPLNQSGVVLIDELDIHLHPIWQWQIAGVLQKTFPKLQFIVATHSPLIAAGAGEHALNYKFDFEDGLAQVRQLKKIAAWNVDRILQSEAFGLLSTYSPETKGKLERFDQLNRKPQRTKGEEQEYKSLFDFMEEAKPIGGPPEPGSLPARIDAFLAHHLS
jgi:energy-coupling factor transporter ATP-binding protein EcfA2